MTRTFLGVDPGLRSGGAAIVDETGRPLLLAGWYGGRYHQSIPAGRIWLDLPAGGSGAQSALMQWTASGVTRVGAAIEQPLTTGVGRHADTGAQSRGGWPSQARDAAREAYLIARWCALEVGP